MGQSIFITATDTDAGKTWITSHLIQALLRDNINAKALKPIACGLNANRQNDDLMILLKAQNLNDNHAINAYSFAMPSAPTIAAQAEQRQLDPQHLKAWCEQHINSLQLCLIEAIGGLMVPLTPHYLVSDWLSDLPDSPVILVVGAKLGCINHALLSLEKLSYMHRPPAWVIINCTDTEQHAQSIAAAIQPYVSEVSRLIICEHQKPEQLSPILAWLKDTAFANQS